MTDQELPVVDASELTARDGTAPEVAGVVLAAGTSSRFGQANKLLADLDGVPVVRRAVRTLLDADLGATYVVVGYQSEGVRSALAGLDVSFVENPEYDRGLSTSVEAAVDELAETSASAAVFLPGDMPVVDPGTVASLVAAYGEDVGDALAAAYEGERGNPVLFDRRYFDSLRAVDGDSGGREVLLGSARGVLVDVDDPGVRRDVDTSDDLDDISV